ncbi:hypothetical protein BDZ94DRAFT_904315 [Collybia nuda]|uniref:Uncharacterized protein n=1 Tax=Collybia nuda TaxID=64659 RepID=A0A9P5YCZ5_9AGAR|nr:hypothetical protein BDZ94DRAFT_904315 [Collybia nuda]
MSFKSLDLVHAFCYTERLPYITQKIKLYNLGPGKISSLICMAHVGLPFRTSDVLNAMWLFATLCIYPVLLNT